MSAQRAITVYTDYKSPYAYLAKDLVHALEAECAAAGVRIQTACAVSGIGRTPGGAFEVDTSCGTFQSAALVVASGGGCSATVPSRR